MQSSPNHHRSGSALLFNCTVHYSFYACEKMINENRGYWDHISLTSHSWGTFWGACPLCRKNLTWFPSASSRIPSALIFFASPLLGPFMPGSPFALIICIIFIESRVRHVLRCLFWELRHISLLAKPMRDQKRGSEILIDRGRIRRSPAKKAFRNGVGSNCLEDPTSPSYAKNDISRSDRWSVTFNLHLFIYYVFPI